MKTTYPIQRQSSTMLQEWATLLADKAGVSAPTFLERPDRYLNFPIETVRVELMDGSHVEFKFAFALIDESMKSIAVFTEHCGHHVFPFHEAKVFRAGALTYENREASQETPSK